MGNELNPYAFNDAKTHLAGATSSGDSEPCSDKDRKIHQWQPDYDMSHPVVQKWHTDAKTHAGDALTIDCHGTITVHYPDCPEEIARKALIQVDHIAKPTFKQIQDEERRIEDLNKGTYHTLDRTQHCYNKDFYGDGWVLKVPGAPDNCGPAQPETRRVETPPPQRREPRPHGTAQIEIINEPGGTINIEDCAPCNTGRRQPRQAEAPHGLCPTCEGASPTWHDTQGPIANDQSGYYAAPQLRGRGWPQGNLNLELAVPGVVPGYRSWQPNNGWQRQGEWIRLPNGQLVQPGNGQLSGQGLGGQWVNGQWVPGNTGGQWNGQLNRQQGQWIQLQNGQWVQAGTGTWNQQQQLNGNWVQLPNGQWVQQNPGTNNWAPNSYQYSTRPPRRWGANQAANQLAWQSDWNDGY